MSKFIEVSDYAEDTLLLINTDEIVTVRPPTTSIAYTWILLRNGNAIKVKETYDDVKKMLYRAF